MASSIKSGSSSPVTEQSISFPRTPTHNPYQRLASRRAIACVTCAKAKTKCDKGLPSCSRCITKGIKCDPRSTRRTSDNSYRTNIRKPFVTPKRYHSSSAITSLTRQTSPKSIPSSSKPRAMRAASHIDFRTAVKMSQQASAASGLSMLTPLPTFPSPVIDGCYSFPSHPEQDLTGYSSGMDSDALPTSGSLTPQTPESIIYHEPLALGDMSDPWMASQSWSDDSFASVGLGFDRDMTTLLPAELWSNHGQVQSAPLTQMPWPHPSLSLSPQSMTSDFAPNVHTAPSLSLSDCSVDDFGNPIVLQEDWTACEPTTNQFDMVNMVTSASFMHNYQPVACAAPIWEDVFIPGSAPY